jgi:hypothetical protein
MTPPGPWAAAGRPDGHLTGRQRTDSHHHP